MKKYVSESRAVYEDYYHGQFSKRLAAWAISKMQTKADKISKTIDVATISLDDTLAAMKANGLSIPDAQVYTAWYLFNMAKADYPKALPSDTHRALFVYETLTDPDCLPEAVLECFVAKMCCMGVPIFWEDYL